MDVFIFKCPDCDADFILVLHGDCWLDETGQFGLVMHPSDQCIGIPHGTYIYEHYYNGLCVRCNRNYYIVNCDKNQRLKREGPIPEREGMSYFLIFEGMEESPQNGFPKVNDAILKNRCPGCKGTLLSGTNIFLKLIDREKSKYFDLPPLRPDEQPMQCPKCKHGFLHYTTSFKA
jgi:hypothetical protein